MAEAPSAYHNLSGVVFGHVKVGLFTGSPSGNEVLHWLAQLLKRPQKQQEVSMFKQPDLTVTFLYKSVLDLHFFHPQQPVVGMTSICIAVAVMLVKFVE